MGTRANILIRDDSGDILWFYRHSDGYPEGTLPTLEKFLDLVKSGKIRNNVNQACGWLVLIGHEEYKNYSENNSWKIGAYEPSTCAIGGTEFFYEIHLGKKEIRVFEVMGDGKKGKLIKKVK